MEESPFDSDLVRRMLPKVNYAALRSACSNIKEACYAQSVQLPVLPDELPYESIDDGLISDLFRVLFDIHIISGSLVCPDTGREFPIKEGIPNMILHEDEL